MVSGVKERELVGVAGACGAPVVLNPLLIPSFFFFFSLSPNTVFPEELSEDGALDIVTPRILYCLIQVRGGWGGTWREAVPRASPS
jgi:hypothetical protein